MFLPATAWHAAELRRWQSSRRRHLWIDRLSNRADSQEKDLLDQMKSQSMPRLTVSAGQRLGP